MKIFTLDEKERKYKIIFYDNNSDVIFITFNVISSNLNSEPFGKNYLIKKGYSVITCFQEKNSQYQELSFEEFKSAVEPAIKDKKIFLYGSSLGGYCSIYYSGAVNGTVIAASPRVSNHPAFQRIYKKTGKEIFNHIDISNLPTTKNQVYIFYDSFERSDKFFLDNVIKKQIPNDNLSIQNCDFVGHQNVIRHLRTAGEFDNIIKSIVNHDGEINKIMSRVKDTDFTNYGKARYHYNQAKLHIEKVKDSSCFFTKGQIDQFEEMKFKFNFDLKFFPENATDLIKEKNHLLKIKNEQKTELLEIKNKIIRLTKENKKQSKAIKQHGEIKNHLSYRLGKILVMQSKTLNGWLSMPFKLYREIKAFKSLR